MRRPFVRLQERPPELRQPLNAASLAAYHQHLRGMSAEELERRLQTAGVAVGHNAAGPVPQHPAALVRQQVLAHNARIAQSQDGTMPRSLFLGLITRLASDPVERDRFRNSGPPRRDNAFLYTPVGGIEIVIPPREYELLMQIQSLPPVPTDEFLPPYAHREASLDSYSHTNYRNLRIIADRLPANLQRLAVQLICYPEEMAAFRRYVEGMINNYPVAPSMVSYTTISGAGRGTNYQLSLAESQSMMQLEAMHGLTGAETPASVEAILWAALERMVQRRQSNMSIPAGNPIPQYQDIVRRVFYPADRPNLRPDPNSLQATMTSALQPALESDSSPLLAPPFATTNWAAEIMEAMFASDRDDAEDVDDCNDIIFAALGLLTIEQKVAFFNDDRILELLSQPPYRGLLTAVRRSLEVYQRELVVSVYGGSDLGMDTAVGHLGSAGPVAGELEPGGQSAADGPGAGGVPRLSEPAG